MDIKQEILHDVGKFENLVEKSKGCWLFTGNKTRKGFGQVWLDGKGRIAHRVAYQLYVGKLKPKPKYVVMQECGNKLCVNPKHLRQSHRVDVTENISYDGYHKWIKRVFGKAEECQNSSCFYPRKLVHGVLVKPTRYHWALIRGKRYEKKRENYIQLCPSCHRLYDEKGLKIKIRHLTSHE